MKKLVAIIGIALIILSGCSKPEKAPVAEKMESDTIQEGVLQGTASVEKDGAKTTIEYSFENTSSIKVTIFGGATYQLVRDQKVIEEGSVPVADYISLNPGEKYKDRVTFSDLEPGSYRVDINWNKGKIATEFVVP
ncbi:hypothetical protein [Gorillibacterium sp. CAU 1737]|uniref:hypothetical protein n=1 Tax=Gorillibacterium sp. CAU 1737 TaxID=3140362 RepID=UPI00326033D4